MAMKAATPNVNESRMIWKTGGNASVEDPEFLAAALTVAVDEPEAAVLVEEVLEEASEVLSPTMTWDWGRTVLASSDCSSIFPEPIMTISPWEGIPSTTRKMYAGPGWKRFALGGI